MSRARFLRLILAIGIASLSLALFIWSLSDPEQIVQHQVIQPNQMQLAAAAIPETRLLTLEYPATIRAGESGRMQLTVEVQQTAPAAQIANVYDTHQVIAETHLDMAGMNIRPSGTTSEPMPQGQHVTFYWDVRPGETGRFQGTAWLYLRFIPKDGGAEIRQAISAQTIETESTTFFGLRAAEARPLGLMGIFISSLLGFSFFVDALKWLWQRKTAQRSP